MKDVPPTTLSGYHFLPIRYPDTVIVYIHPTNTGLCTSRCTFTLGHICFSSFVLFKWSLPSLHSCLWRQTLPGCKNMKIWWEESLLYLGKKAELFACRFWLVLCESLSWWRYVMPISVLLLSWLTIKSAVGRYYTSYPHHFTSLLAHMAGNRSSSVLLLRSSPCSVG